MDFKKMWKRFFTLDRHHTEGFTLVELIVVIAILAILGGVAVPAYSGYVEKTNKQADITLANEVAHALILQYYANPTQTMVASVALTTDGASADGEFATAAMASAFGDSWQTSEALKLKYDKWGNGAAVANEVINYFKNNDNPALDPIFNGSTNISYTDNIPELFELMENTACDIAGKRESLGSGASMVTHAAGITMNKDAAEFSNLWASSAWNSDYLMGSTGSYDGNAGNLTDAALNNAIANAAVIKARNVALATYLKDQGYEEVYSAIADYTYSDSVVPNDAAAVVLKMINQQTPSGEDSALLDQVFPVDKDDDYITGLQDAIKGYYSKAEGQNSQAYNDGLAYFAMMSTVNKLKNSTNLDQSNDETWWNDLSSAINMYGSIANGSVNLDDLHNLYNNMGSVSGNTVVAMLVVKNGVPNAVISPVGAES